jgi:hypothetical protein
MFDATPDEFVSLQTDTCEK